MRIDPNKCVACGNCTYVCPMGAIYIDPVDRARHRESRRVRRVLRLLQRVEPGASESHAGADHPQDISDDAGAFRSRAGCLPDGRVRARGADVAESGAPRILRPASAA